jgi:hypothetical protein
METVVCKLNSAYTFTPQSSIITNCPPTQSHTAPDHLSTDTASHCTRPIVHRHSVTLHQTWILAKSTVKCLMFLKLIFSWELVCFILLFYLKTRYAPGKTTFHNQQVKLSSSDQHIISHNLANCYKVHILGEECNMFKQSSSFLFIRLRQLTLSTTI